MSEQAVDGRTTVVLDVDSGGQRRLEETVAASGYRTATAQTLDEAVEGLRTGASPVALIAFEALWPAPERSLTRIREEVPSARIMVAFREDGPRLVLGRRLWSVSLIDYWIPRSTPPHEMVALLNQAHTEALIERSARELPGADRDDTEEAVVELIANLSMALGNARKLDELLRVFHRKLYRIVDYQLLQILSCAEEPYRLFSFPVTKVTSDQMLGLTSAACDAIAPHIPGALLPEDLAVFDALPLLDGAGSQPSGSPVHDLMMLHGQTLGCVSVLPYADRPLRRVQRSALTIVTSHLASASHNVETIQSARAAATSDELTGLPNRGFLAAALRQEWPRASRYRAELTVVVLDIDDFSDINRRYGHAVGDEVLRRTGALLGQYVRETDHVIYFGADRFLLLLVETGAPEAAIVVERMRLALKKKPIIEAAREGPIQVTCSAGIASYPTCAVTTPEGLVDLAVQAVDKARTTGRDQVIVASDQAFDAVFEDQPSSDKRRYPRIPSELAVKYIELPDFEGHLTTSKSLNVNARGIAIEDPNSRLRRHSYALVYVEDAQMPVLSRVVWTQEGDEGKRSAGLEFLQAGDIDDRVKTTRSHKLQPKALVITDNPETWVQVERVFIAAQYQLQLLKKGMELPPAEELEDFAIVVVGEQALADWLGPKLDLLRERLRPPARVVVINESKERAHALETIARYRIDHFVSASAISDAALFATLNKLLLGEYFGMQKYLLWGVTPKSWIVRTIDDKDDMLDKIRHVAQEVYCHPRLTDLLVSAVDEMVINAMYRTGDASAEGGVNQVTVECGTDGRLLAVSVIDELGTFLAGDLHRGLTQGLLRKRDGVPESAASAGLGFRIMLDCLSQLAINVEPGQRTEVIGIVDLRKPFREFRQSVPTLGLFDKESS